MLLSISLGWQSSLVQQIPIEKLEKQGKTGFILLLDKEELFIDD